MKDKNETFYPKWVKLLRDDYIKGVPVKELATKYEISIASAYRCVNGETFPSKSYKPDTTKSTAGEICDMLGLGDQITPKTTYTTLKSIADEINKLIKSGEKNDKN